MRLTVPRMCSHSGPDNQKGYRTEAEIEADNKRDPMPRLKRHLVPAILSAAEWTALEKEVERDVSAALDAARARPGPAAESVGHHVYADDSPSVAEAHGGLSRAERAALSGTDVPRDDGDMLRSPRQCGARWRASSK